MTDKIWPIARMDKQTDKKRLKTGQQRKEYCFALALLYPGDHSVHKCKSGLKSVGTGLLSCNFAVLTGKNNFISYIQCEII